MTSILLTQLSGTSDLSIRVSSSGVYKTVNVLLNICKQNITSLEWHDSSRKHLFINTCKSDFVCVDSLRYSEQFLSYILCFVVV